MTLRRYLGLFGFLFVAVSGLICQPASAATRVALVIGNSEYRNVPQLTNPDNDAAAFAEAMKQAGFDVVEARHDMTGAAMRRALRDLGDKARNPDMAVI
jgi:uncharacterized caspase-like protein